MQHQFRHPTGMTLIEVMVALLVLSIGLVGVAALTISSVTSAHSAYYRTLASAMAVDAEERMWINFAESNDIDITLGTVESDWNDEWATLLPGLDASLNLAESSSTFWRDVDILITWDEGRFDEDQAKESFGYRARIFSGAF